nr:NifB/NifX family molybdenum-iron cluster-binding protein [uncultured Desulfobulbus sp.]
MNIAVSASGVTPECLVYEDFAKTPYLLIVNVDTMECNPIEHTPSPGSEEELARSVVSNRCEAVITGRLSETAFDILADDGITRLSGGNMTVKNALAAMERRELSLIRNAQGTDDCSGTHHH